jgi:hypothetical protein
MSYRGRGRGFVQRGGGNQNFKGAGKKPPCENGFTCEFLGSDKKCSYYHTNLIEDIKMKKQLDNLMQVMRGLN